jgi:hypothetical protein
VLEHASAPPSPCTLCALSALAIHAAQGQPGRERRGWYPLGQLEEELDAVARTGDQMVEVLHFMGGEDSPRRVLCPWQASQSPRYVQIKYIMWILRLREINTF